MSSQPEPGAWARGVPRSPLECFESWRAFADGIPDTLLLVDEQGVVQYVNHPPFGVPCDLVVGARALDWAPPGAREELRRALSDVFREGATRSGVQRALHPDGVERWWALHAGPVLVRGVVIAAMVAARDVTRSRRDRDALLVSEARRRDSERRLDEQARHFERTATLARFALGVAHDFANVVTVISCSATQALHLVGEAHEAAPDLRAILDAAHHGSALTAQLRTFARRGSLPADHVDLNDVVRTIVGFASRLAHRGIQIVQRLDPDGAPVWGHWSQLEQVVMNLLFNARDAIGERDGTIVISTSRLPASTELRVVDTGAGMTEEVRRRIFDPFFTTKHSSGGTGLGLATVHAAVSAAGGRIDVESAPGRGTSFVLRFPTGRTGS